MLILLPQGTLKSEPKTTERGAQPSVNPCEPRWVQLQPLILVSETSAGEISSKTFGNLFLETMTSTTSAWMPAHVICVQLVGTGLSCAFLSL